MKQVVVNIQNRKCGVGKCTDTERTCTECYTKQILSLLSARIKAKALTDVEITNLVNGYNAVDHSSGGISVFKYIAAAQLQAVLGELK